MADSAANTEIFKNLEPQDRVRVYDALLDYMVTFEGLQEFRLVAKEVKLSGGSYDMMSTAYQKRLDELKDEYARNLKFLSPLEKNGIPDTADLGIRGNMSRYLKQTILGEVAAEQPGDPHYQKPEDIRKQMYAIKAAGERVFLPEQRSDLNGADPAEALTPPSTPHVFSAKQNIII